MPHLSPADITQKRQKFLLSILGGVIILVSAIVLFSITPSGYVLFVYTRESVGKAPRIAEVRSGYKSLQECKDAGAIFSVSVHNTPISFARCGSVCPLFAESEQDCKAH